MQPTIYAAFNDASDAERAAGALMDHGIKAEEICLIVSEAGKRAQQKHELEYTHNQTVAPLHSASDTLDPLGNNRRDTPIRIDPVPEEGQNPAQNDYPASGTGGSWSVSSAPSEARRDFNKGLESDDYNAHYKNDVERENEAQAERERQFESQVKARTEPGEGLDVSRPEADQTIGPAAYDSERAAKAGISTTTIEDAGEAAKKGALWGLGVGALAAVAALAVPGFGVVLGGGALAAASAALAASAGAGAVAGGVVGYLKDQGVPAHDIPHYQKAVENGGALIAVHLDEGRDRAEIEDLLKKYGAGATHDYGYAA
jgi:predicted phage tail protein